MVVSALSKAHDPLIMGGKKKIALFAFIIDIRIDYPFGANVKFIPGRFFVFWKRQEAVFNKLPGNKVQVPVSKAIVLGDENACNTQAGQLPHRGR